MRSSLTRLAIPAALALALVLALAGPAQALRLSPATPMPDNDSTNPYIHKNDNEPPRDTLESKDAKSGQAIVKTPGKIIFLRQDDGKDAK